MAPVDSTSTDEVVVLGVEGLVEDGAVVAGGVGDVLLIAEPLRLETSFTLDAGPGVGEREVLRRFDVLSRDFEVACCLNKLFTDCDLNCFFGISAMTTE